MKISESSFSEASEKDDEHIPCFFLKILQNICREICLRMDVTRTGTLVGEDKFGNKYFEDNSYFMPRNRWVVYPDRVWLDYDATQVAPEW